MPEISGTKRENVAYVEGGVGLPTKSGEIYWITEGQIREWQAIYKRFDVRTECEKMRMWLESNPTRRKVNTKLYAQKWLNRRDQVPDKPGDATASAAAGYRERIHAEAAAERAKPTASAEIARAALAEAKRMLGLRP